MKRLTIGTALLVETLSPKNKVKCIVPQKRYFPTLTKALLRTHEFLSRRGKEPKAAGGRRGFHAARRPPAPPLTSGLCRWSLAGAPRTVSLRFRTNGPVENVPFSTMGLCLGEGRRSGERCASRTGDAVRTILGNTAPTHLCGIAFTSRLYILVGL